MKLRLVDHTYLAPIRNGVHLITPAGPLTLTGTSIARWVEALAPHLDGRSSLAEITAGLPPAHADLARSILIQLRDAGVVREIAAEPAQGAGDDEPGGFAAEVAFVEAHIDGARAAFARFRDLSVAVANDGLAADPLPEAIAASLRASGAARVRVCDADGLGEEDLWSLDVLLLTSALGPAAERARFVDRAARDGLAVGHVLRDGTDVWYVPVRAAKDDPLVAVRPESLRARLRRAPRAPEAITGVHVEVAAAQVGRAVFRWATGTADPRHASRPTRLGPDLITSRHHCQPHPYELPAAPPTPDAVLSRVDHLRSRPAEDAQEFSDAAVRAADELFGPFRFLPDDSAAQSPLHVSEAEAGDVLAPGPGVTVRAVGFAYAGTRIEAARRALARYAALTVDPRRLVDSGGTALAAEDAEPAALYAAVTAGAPGGFAIAYDLAAAAPVRLAAARAFPRLAGQRAAPGEGFGATWEEAVARGLCAHWTRDADLIDDPAGRPVTADPAGLDAVGRRCFTLLAELGELPEVHDHGGRFGVTSLSFHRGGTEVARTAGTASSAWTQGLLETLFSVQRRIHAGRTRPWAAAQPARATIRLDPGHVIDPDGVAVALAATGRRAVVLPLDHDPAVAAIAPLSLRVAIAGSHDLCQA
ncbi:hypothetical protein [Nonomuraea sp. GTA35]|uniref:hypothetical protein n=1 Tax=Nonomuraea sp. GTA35 TaxID=1676746 RepID=UPI0035C20E1A